MTVIVGIFDNAANLDRAVETLSDRGLDDAVFDQNIVSQEAFTGTGTPYVPVQTNCYRAFSRTRTAIRRAWREAR